MSNKEINDYLLQAISKYSIIGKKMTKKVAEGLKDEFVFESFSSNASIMEIRDVLIKLGKILEEDIENEIYVVVVGSGFLNMNPCIVVVKKEEKKVLLNAYAKEGILNQNTARKTIRLVEKAIK